MRLLFATALMTLALAFLVLANAGTVSADGPWPVSSGTLEENDTFSNTVWLDDSTDLTYTVAYYQLTAELVDTGEAVQSGELVHALKRCGTTVTGYNSFGGALFQHRTNLEFYFTGVHTYPYTDQEAHQTWLGWTFHHTADNWNVGYNVDWSSLDFFEGPL